MSRIRSKGSRAEQALRGALHAAGYRFRLHVRSMPGCPDIVLPKYGAVVQVRGCFWHGHDCIDGHIPKSHEEYWVPKLAANKARDRRNDRLLRAAGWRVITVWECQLSSEPKLARQLARIVGLLAAKPEFADSPDPAVRAAAKRSLKKLAETYQILSRK